MAFNREQLEEASQLFFRLLNEQIIQYQNL
jgi:hypothetical protein